MYSEKRRLENEIKIYFCVEEKIEKKKGKKRNIKLEKHEVDEVKENGRLVKNLVRKFDDWKNIKKKKKEEETIIEN